MNLATYGFTILAARILGPQDYGALAALMAVAAGRRRAPARPPGDRGPADRRRARPRRPDRAGDPAGSPTARAAVVGLGAVLVLAPAPRTGAAPRQPAGRGAGRGSAAVPLTIMGGQAGILQGERRWGPLAVLYLASGVPRLVIGTALILWRPTELAAIARRRASAPVVPVLVGWSRPAPHRATPGVAATSTASGRSIREIVHNSQALLAFFALSNVDIDRRPQRPRRARRRPLRRRPDPGQGHAVPAAVRRRRRLPVHGHRTSERRRALVRSLALVAGARRRRRPLGALAAAAAGAGLRRRRRTYAEIDDLAVDLRRSSARCSSMLQLLVYSVLARQGRAVGATWSGSRWSCWSVVGLTAVDSLARRCWPTVADRRRRAARCCCSCIEPAAPAGTDSRPSPSPSRRSATPSTGSVSGVVPAAAGADRHVERARRGRRRRPSARGPAPRAPRARPAPPRRRARRAPGAASASRSPASAMRRGSTSSIATLIRSAAEPWIGALSAIRSAISRRCRLSLVRSGR